MRVVGGADEQGQVDASRREALAQLGAAVDAELDAVAGLGLVERGREVRQQLGGGVLGRADDDGAAGLAGEAAQPFVVQREDAARQAEQLLAVGGEPRAAAAPLDQRAADGRLEAADVLAHRALAEVQGVGGALEATGVGDGDEAAQRSDVQRTVHASSIAIIPTCCKGIYHVT
ncbi:hypothetical protein GCM10020001_107670 [Nonomuraea salmonea]